MELRKLDRDSEDIALLEKINEEAIPENERNSLDDMFATGADGNLDIIGIYLLDEPVGFMMVRKYKNIRYLAYFAVRSDLRSKGIGSEALRRLIDGYPGCRTVVEYEAPDDNSDNNDIRLRRKGFYRRCGFNETGYYTRYDGMEFEIGCAGREYDAAEFDGFIDYLGTIVSDHIPKPYRKDARAE